MLFIGLTSGVLVLCILMNSLFLKEFYKLYKKDTMLRMHSILNSAMDNGSIQNPYFQNDIYRMCGRYNTTFIILDSDASEVLAVGSDSGVLKRQLYDILFDASGIIDIESTLLETENHRIHIVNDHRSGTTFMVLWGLVGKDSYLYLQSPMESVEESAMIANRFLINIGILVIICSVFLIMMVIRRITRPIMELTDISKQMARLDFSAKYRGNGRDEVDTLGRNINELSGKLESTISELKNANNELRRDIEQKDRIDEMRKDFLSSVSHELKTPIALIQGYSEGLLESVNDDEESRRYYAEVIMDEAGRMNRMVKQLLILGEMESASNPVSMERFDITALIRNYIASCDILLRQHDIRLVFPVTESMYVWGDEFRIEEVVMNFMNNAINHTEENGYIKVDIRRVSGADRSPASFLRVEVFNTGAPIPVDAMEHIWEKFYKVDKSRTREYGGSGVGLSIVKAIMESHNTAYGVENLEDGVQFYFELEEA